MARVAAGPSSLKSPDHQEGDNPSRRSWNEPMGRLRPSSPVRPQATIPPGGPESAALRTVRSTAPASQAPKSPPPMKGRTGPRPDY